MQELAVEKPPKAFIPVHEPKTSVLIVGPFREQFENLLKKAREQNLDLDIRFGDKDRRPFYNGEQFAIVQRHSSHNWWNSLKAQLPNNHLLFSPGGITDILRKLREIENKNKISAQ